MNGLDPVHILWGLVTAFGAYIFHKEVEENKATRAMAKELYEDNEERRVELARLQAFVVENFAKKTEVHELEKKIDHRFDRIENILLGKKQS